MLATGGLAGILQDRLGCAIADVDGGRGPEFRREGGGQQLSGADACRQCCRHHPELLPDREGEDEAAEVGVQITCQDTAVPETARPCSCHNASFLRP